MKREILEKILREKNGVLLTRDVVDAGISKTYLMEYVKKLNLERVAMGVYLDRDVWADFFYLLQLRYPRTVFSHETALYLLGMAEREPLQFTVTVKAGYHAESMKEQDIKVYRIKKELFEVGVTEAETPAGNRVKIYNPERTICDLLRNRKNIEVQDLQSALKEYTHSREKNIPLLMRYAKQFRVERLLRQYLEVLL